MDEEDLKSLVKDIIHEDLLPVFLDMLKASDERINRTNEMVMMLSESTSNFSRLCNTQLVSATESRDIAQKNAAEMIKANMELTKLVEQTNADLQKLISDYKRELHSAKDKILQYEKSSNELMKRLDQQQEKHELLQDKYDKLVENYERLAEKSIEHRQSSSSRADVKISH